MRLKSLFVGTLLAMVGILALSFLVFQAISHRMQTMTIDPTFNRMDELQLQSAREDYERGGQAALAHYIEMLNRIFYGKHFLLNAQGVDLATGENRADLLPPPPATKSRIHTGERWIITRRSQDGKYWFAAVGRLYRIHIWTFLPYYFLVIGATAALFWLAAVGVVMPIRRIAGSIAAFGAGELATRVRTKREDEIGQLARSFNQMAERLERLIVSERRLLGDISHELRSPLARLKFAIKLARTSPDSKSALDRIERDVNRIALLVSDIVEITFVEGDPALRSSEAVVVSDVVREVVSDCSVEAEMRGCRIQLTGTSAGQVTGSRELVRRAIENVVRNAIRYSPENSTIEACMEEDGRKATFSVRDHGPGVPEEMLSRIFDPFFRVEEARDTNGGGSGLGLSIAKRAVQAHQGAIVAENASPGLRLRIVLPLMDAAVEAADAGAATGN